MRSYRHSNLKLISFAWHSLKDQPVEVLNKCSDLNIRVDRFKNAYVMESQAEITSSYHTRIIFGKNYTKNIKNEYSFSYLFPWNTLLYAHNLHKSIVVKQQPKTAPHLNRKKQAHELNYSVERFIFLIPWLKTRLYLLSEWY